MKRNFVKTNQKELLKLILEENDPEYELGFFQTPLGLRDGIDVPCCVYPQVGMQGDKFPRLRFQNNTNSRYYAGTLIPITLSDNPEIIYAEEDLNLSDEDFSKLKSWIIENKDALMKHWTFEYSSLELYKYLDSKSEKSDFGHIEARRIFMLKSNSRKPYFNCGEVKLLIPETPPRTNEDLKTYILENTPDDKDLTNIRIWLSKISTKNKQFTNLELINIQKDIWSNK